MEDQSNSYNSWRSLNYKFTLNGHNPGLFLIGCALIIVFSIGYISSFSNFFLFSLIGLIYYFIIYGAMNEKLIKNSGDKNSKGPIESPIYKSLFNKRPKFFKDEEGVLNRLINYKDE